MICIHVHCLTTWTAGFSGPELDAKQDLVAKLPWSELDILVNNCGTNIRNSIAVYQGLLGLNTT